MYYVGYYGGVRPWSLEFQRTNAGTASGEGSISDDHIANMLWECGDPSYEGPPSEEPMYSGGLNGQMQIAAHRQITSRRPVYSFQCRFCNEGITFFDRKPFDPNGPHRCLSAAAARAEK